MGEVWVLSVYTFHRLTCVGEGKGSSYLKGVLKLYVMGLAESGKYKVTLIGVPFRSIKIGVIFGFIEYR